MPTFRYKALRRTGELVAGQRDAGGVAEVERWLGAQDLIPLETAAAGGVRRGRGGGRLTAERRAVLTRELATLLGAGLRLDDALALMVRLAGNAGDAARLDRVLQRIRHGSPFAEALAGEGTAFPPDYVALVRAGEHGGALPEVLARLAETLRRSRTLRRRVVSSLIYPIILVVVAIAAVAVLLLVVVPAFEPMFADTGRDLPPATRFLVDLAGGLRMGLLPGLLLLAALALGWHRLPAGAAPKRAWRGLLLRTPLLGALLVRLDTTRFARTLATLIGNGLPLLAALGLARDALHSPELAETIRKAQEELRGGRLLGDQLMAQRLWPPLMGELIRVGEETGRLPQMLAEVAEIFDEEAVQTLERLTALITPVVTLVLGLVVSGILAALLSAVLAINDLAF